VEISVASVGYRSAFVGAALAALPGARTAQDPLRVLLPPSAPGVGTQPAGTEVSSDIEAVRDAVRPRARGTALLRHWLLFSQPG
jgi:hypothetical protein